MYTFGCNKISGEQNVENTEQIQYNDGRIVVPYDKDRKKVTFYDTYVDINGDVVRYDDIAVFQSEALDSSSDFTIYFSKSFSYKFSFTTYDGTKHELKRMGYSAYGLGTYKRIKKEFDPIAEPMYDIVLNKVNDRLIARIESGASANICGLTINKDKLTLEKKKQTVVIDKSNFAGANFNNFPMNQCAQIFLKGEKKPVFKESLNEPNARLIVPVVNYFLSGEGA